MNTFFNEDGLLNLDEAVMEMESFKKIMEDGIVTDEEVVNQANHVAELLHRIEDTCSPEQSALVKEALSEISVLYTVYHYKELQTLK
ncbi:MAG: hypothetical protein II849_02050 [Bacteroidales bacterium]|nr:hypothetical protein [Bacteroidales bacterium]